MVAKTLVVAAAVLLLVAAPGSARHTGVATGVQRMTSFDSQVLAQMNSIRARHGLHALHLSRRLAAAAGEHSSQMAKRGYFGHQSADGTTMPDRVDHYYSSRNRRYWSVGENLVWESPTMSPAQALDMWMHSAPHRANILAAEWRDVGLAAVHATSAPGVYDHAAVTILTADFGVRR